MLRPKPQFCAELRLLFFRHTINFENPQNYAHARSFPLNNRFIFTYDNSHNFAVDNAFAAAAAVAAADTHYLHRKQYSDYSAVGTELVAFVAVGKHHTQQELHRQRLLPATKRQERYILERV